MRCTLHNKLMLDLGNGPMCAACLGEKSAGTKQMMDGVRLRSADRALKVRTAAASVPPEFEDATFANFVTQTPLAETVAKALSTYCQNFAAHRARRTGFVFTGTPGTGKTHLACAMVNQLLAAGFAPVYASLPRLTSLIRSTYGKSGATDALMRSLIDCDLLVLDEIDLHGTSDTDYSTLFDIIDSRYVKQGFPTVALSNRPLDRIKNDLDERVTSRILGGSKAIACDWPSRRELPANQRRAQKAVA